MFEVGDKVVCVDAKPKRGLVGPLVPVHHLLREGQVYTIAAITYSTNQTSYATGRKTLAFVPSGILKLAGLTLPHPMTGFSAYRFRKVDTRKESEPKRASTKIPALA
ncbi:hypothetical protein [Erythrobacter sp.]|uniref:hypothetical protein n=1 Tax=Erythrobacter sp. TaxID=1042 RepID=UPI00261FC553|nr:hypothetical protein [Erythrobacter sp.]